MPMVGLSIDFDDLPGVVEVSERDAQDENGLWSSTMLVEKKEAEPDLSVTLNDDGAKIYVSAHHVENDETKRAFHVRLDLNLSWNDIARLHDFLELLIKCKDEETT